MSFARFLSIAILLGFVPGLYAGLYNPAEPDAGKLYPDEFSGLFLPKTLVPLQTIGSRRRPGDPFIPLRTRHQFIDENADRRLHGRSTLERLSLSAYLIRQGKPRLAARILEQLTREDPNNFVAAANLMTAYYLLGLPSVHRKHETEVMGRWPEKMADLSKEMQILLTQMDWDQKSITGSKYAQLRRAERYFQKLLELRDRERETGRMRQLRDHLPDALFGDALRFDRKDEFRVGKPPANARGELPEDAVEIVQQLLVWLPTDSRLLWLLGEVYNAKGDVYNAKGVYKKLTGGLSPAYGGPNMPPFLAAQKEALAKHKVQKRQSNFPQDLAKKVSKQEDAKPAYTPPIVDWRALFVGVGAGIVISYIGYWQIRQLTRPKQKK